MKSEEHRTINSSKLPFHVKSEFIDKVQSIGKNGHDYKNTEISLIEATKKTLDKL